MKTELYKITTLSNLHVGSGDINFDVIDNQVQRDAITQLPNINASSLKGAFRAHFSKDDEESNMVKYIFGPSNSDNDSHQTGAYSFFEAQLLTRPVRSNVKAYFNATSPLVIKNLLQMIDSFNIVCDATLKQELQNFSQLPVKKGSPFIFESITNARLEDVQAVSNTFDTTILKSFLGEDIALFEDTEYAELDLPVLARNYLEDGVSKNLWYEEVVPKASTFFFSIAKPTNVDAKDLSNKINGYNTQFDTQISLMQFGANKSIGYGFCNVEKVSQ